MYKTDPLVYHSPLRARWIVEMMNSIAVAREKIGQIRCPVLLLHGTVDHLVPFSASEFILENIGSEDKTFEVRKNLTHTNQCCRYFYM